MTRRRALVALGVAVLAVVIAVSLAIADEAPRFFLDGARPDSGATSGSEQDVADRCVPYSADRTDVQICGELPPGWEPPPKPYFDSRVCDAALDWLEDRGSPPVDSDSCLVNEGSGAWHVVFVRVHGGGNVHVPFDPSGTSPNVAHA
jgi:hypothetical protein